MKKIISIVLCFCLAFSLVACGKDKEEQTQTNAKEYKYQIAMLCAEDAKSIDDGSIVQTTWEGVRAYAEENNKTYKYYEAAEASEEAILEQVGLAKEAGAEVIICAGDGFGKLLDTVTEATPDVTFIAIDAGQVTTKNCASYIVNQLQAGFLAGYAAICDGNRSVAFIADTENEESRKFGYGFLQGAAAAGRQFGGYRDVFYTYGDGNEKTKIKNWLDNGVDIIFTCGDNSYGAAKSLVKDYGTMIIVNNQEYYDGKTAVACAYGEYSQVISKAINSFYEGKLKTGKCHKMGVKSDAVGLKWNDKKLTGFTLDDYNYAFDRLAKDGYDIASENKYSSVKKLVKGMNLYSVQITYQK